MQIKPASTFIILDDVFNKLKLPLGSFCVQRSIFPTIFHPSIIPITSAVKLNTIERIPYTFKFLALVDSEK